MYFVNTKFMWKIAIIGFVLMLIGLCSILAGCGAPPSSENASYRNRANAWVPHGNCTSTKVVEIDSHKYIIMVGFKAGNIIHAESCSCRK